MATQVFIKSNAAFVAAKLQKRIEKMKADGQTETAQAATFGKELMFRLAPKDTGATARAISYRQGKRADGASATILIGDGHPERRGKINGVGLTYYMNYVTKSGSPSYNHFRTGEPHFIEVGVEETRKRFKSGVRRLVNSFVTGK